MNLSVSVLCASSEPSGLLTEYKPCHIKMAVHLCSAITQYNLLQSINNAIYIPAVDVNRCRPILLVCGLGWSVQWLLRVTLGSPP